MVRRDYGLVDFFFADKKGLLCTLVQYANWEMCYMGAGKLDQNQTFKFQNEIKYEI